MLTGEEGAQEARRDQPGDAGTTPVPGRPMRSLRLALVAVNVLVMLLCAATLHSRRQSEIELSRLQTANTAALLARGAEAVLDKARGAVDSVADRLEHDMGGPGLQRNIIQVVADRAVKRVPELQAIGVFDEAGAQICGEPAERCRNLDVSDREFLAHYRDEPDAAPAVYGPMASRDDGQPVLVLVRALRLEGGRFGGLALGLLPLVQLNGIVGAASLGPRGVASLRSAGSLALLARAPAMPEALQAPQLAALKDALGDLMQRSPQTGVFEFRSSIDGAERINAYQKLSGYPIYAFVADAVADSQAQWRGMLASTIGFLLAFMVCTLVIERLADRNRRNELHVRRLFDEAPCGYHTLDAQGRFTSINATALRWLGLRREDVVGKATAQQFLTDEGRAMFARHFPRLLAGEPVQALEYDLVATDGSARRVSVSATPVFDAAGHFVSSNTVTHDISALHQARSQLRDQHALQQLLLDNELVGIARVKDRRFVWTNRAFGRLYGYEGAELLGQETAVLYADRAGFEAFGREFAAALAARGSHRATIELRRKDGTPVWADCSGATLGSTTGEVMWFSLDLTASRRAEALRVEAAELAAENRQLQETARLHSTFLSNMSHELRTPLNAIVGFASLLQMQSQSLDADRRVRYVGRIMDSARHLLAMIESLLELTRLEGSRMQLQPQPLDVALVLREVVDMLEPGAQSRQLQVRIDLGLMPTVSLDPLRLKQVLLNYLANAIKFSRAGGTVVVRAWMPSPDRLRVEVEDQGIGISDADQGRLFVRFQQLSTGWTKAYEGTGIGLALVKQIVEAQGGQVGVRSEVGKGSTFWAELPVER